MIKEIEKVKNENQNDSFIEFIDSLNLQNYCKLINHSKENI
jgi:hypothetical protein